jgi:CheY-like chemotaxis protein
LGLALVKNLVTLHGGTVHATSKGLGAGSEFVARLPALPVTLRRTATPATAVPIADRVRRRILVVDDNEDARELLADMLRALGYNVALAPDGPSALDKLETFSADAAILDLGLPVMDGFELARHIIEKGSNRRPRLIALTGYGGQADMARTRATGFDAHLVKPVNVAMLVSVIDGEAARARTNATRTGPEHG